MLANPHLAPFELIQGEFQRQDWTLIDHLMIVHKVWESDYIEGDPLASIASMARTLASGYLWETARSRIVVLVKDGERAPKPAMRDIRDKRPVVPHIDFCMRNLGAVEYTMMKLMADVGMKDKLFLVTGGKGHSPRAEEPQGTPADIVVSFHHKFLAYKELEDNLVSLDVLEDLVPDIEMCDVDGSYVDGCVERPECTDGVFVATFADPESREVSILREACLGCTSTEADTLLVELANVLGGSVTVCSGDSDLVAVLTACGREGITLRMENRSYHEDREMHTSPFGELLCATPQERGSKLPRGELSSSELRFRALCDVAEEDQGLAHTQREQHVKFENIVAGNEKLGSEEEVARYLYVGGIRGSLYSLFLSRATDSNARNVFEELGRAVEQRAAGKNTVRFIFETLYPPRASPESSSSESECYTLPYSRAKRRFSCPGDRVPEVELDEGEEHKALPSEGENPPCSGEKRKFSHVEDRVPEVELDDGEDCKAPRSKAHKQGLRGLLSLSKAYMQGRVPRGSHGRFLRLRRSGRHLSVRIKPEVVRDERERHEKLFFMALCGTDYNVMPMGLGIVRLMHAAVTERESFSSWCTELKGLLWGTGSPLESEYHRMGMKLAGLAKLPEKTQSKYWTEVNCGLMARTTKYVCELWNLKRPIPGPEYGFSVRDGVVRFDYPQSADPQTLNGKCDMYSQALM
ncbi:hypothetical protein KUCAC02_033084 [Chaenocephalus aceratus]|nr:hypothetical protein KUCAC02_033084 [Chaenocephalus aceratus]